MAKNIGDNVEKGDAILELETDKVNVEVVSEEDGILQEQLASEGDTVEVGQAIAIVGEGKGSTSSSSKSQNNDSTSENENIKQILQKLIIQHHALLLKHKVAIQVQMTTQNQSIIKE